MQLENVEYVPCLELVTVAAGDGEFVLTNKAYFAPTVVYLLKDGEVSETIQPQVREVNGETVLCIGPAPVDREVQVPYYAVAPDGTQRVVRKPDDPPAPRARCRYCGGLSDHYGTCDNCGAPLMDFV